MIEKHGFALTRMELRLAKEKIEFMYHRSDADTARCC